MPKQVRPRGEKRYDKPALDHEQLLQRLIARGLEIPDPSRAQRYLRHIGYYRFSPYLIPYRQRVGEDDLRPGTSFDDVLDLYVFDRRLRLLVLDAVERIEVAVRAALTDHMSVTYGDPFWYASGEYFSDGRRHGDFLTMIRRDLAGQLSRAPESSDDEYTHTSALEHYLTTYGEPEFPPSWLLIETLTIGQLHGVVINLRRRSDRTAVARPLGLTEPLLTSWLRTYVRVRNVCAHHGRLWNVGLGVYPKLPSSASVPWLADPSVLRVEPGRARRLYPVLVSLQSVLTTISPGSSWARRLGDLLERHPEVPLAGMGMPTRWRDDPFWAARL